MKVVIDDFTMHISIADIAADPRLMKGRALVRVVMTGLPGPETATQEQWVEVNDTLSIPINITLDHRL